MRFTGGNRFEYQYNGDHALPLTRIFEVANGSNWAGRHPVLMARTLQPFHTRDGYALGAMPAGQANRESWSASDLGVAALKWPGSPPLIPSSAALAMDKTTDYPICPREEVSCLNAYCP